VRWAGVQLTRRAIARADRRQGRRGPWLRLRLRLLDRFGIGSTRGAVGVTAATSTAAPERAKWPRLAGSPHPQLRSLLPRGYACFTEATTPRHLVLPATTLVSLVVKLLDSPHRPPAFVMGAHGSSTFVEGDCAAPSAVLTVQTAGALPSVDEIPTAPRHEPGSDHAAVVATFDI
jgi:hypothetical protein